LAILLIVSPGFTTYVTRPTCERLVERALPRAEVFLPGSLSTSPA
jgi:hypothetical protein